MDTLTQWILGLAIGALAWFMKAKMNAYDRKHERHFEEVAALKERCAATEALVDLLKPNNHGRRS